MLNGAKIAFIGAGAMGGAIIKGLLAENAVQPNQIVASDPVESQRTRMASEYGIKTTADNCTAVQDANIVIICVKPQIFPLVTPDLQGQIPPEALVVSIMAGINIAAMREGLACTRIVRCMPNTPAQVGMGVTGWLPTADVTEEQIGQTAIILRALGEQIRVPAEHYIDMVTGLSGSGPAYVFLFIEALIDAGVRMGFMRADAEKLALQTVRGSAELLQQSGEHPAVLRNLVTSPGGTTAAVIFELEAGGLRTIVDRAVHAAYQRSVELGE